MTTLTQIRLPIPSADMNGESTLPLLYDASLPREPQQTLLDEDDGLSFDRATAKPPKKFDFRMNVSD